MATYTEDEVDIPFIINLLRPVPIYSGVAYTYEELLGSWEDPRPVPTWAEIENEWDTYLQKKFIEETEGATLKTELITLINSTSYADLEAKVNSVFANHSAGQKEFLLRIFRIVLFLGKRNLVIDPD